MTADQLRSLALDDLGAMSGRLLNVADQMEAVRPPIQFLQVDKVRTFSNCMEEIRDLVVSAEAGFSRGSILSTEDRLRTLIKRNS
jgi:hypothetical protein